MSIRWISAFDLMSNDEAQSLVKDENSLGFYSLLFDIGFDITRDIEWQDVYCRSVVDHNIICYGRWVGFERLDKEWMNSPYCSFENRILSNSKKDRWLVEQLYVMSEESNFTGKLVRQLEETFGRSTEYEKPDEEDAIFSMIRNSNKHKESLKGGK
jgi:hypothetical protein